MTKWINLAVKKYAVYRSWKTSRKLLVIESDDWGSLRMPSRQAYQSLSKRHDGVATDPYCQYDTLASVDDLSELYKVLGQVRDKNGRPAVVTANVNVANPRFDTIAANHYTTYHYEPFFETIRRQPQGEEVLKSWQQGIADGVFHPQLHGREHVHALAWLAELRADNRSLLDAFEHGVWGVPYHALTTQRRNNLQAALDIYNIEGEAEFQQRWLSESVDIFESYFGYKPITFIPPAYIWHTRLIPYIAAMGIRGVQGISLQYQPRLNGHAGYKKKIRFTGQSAGHGVRYLVRNTFFEPALQPGKDWVAATMAGIEQAFKNRQPAIVGSHRVNYIGTLVEENRTRNLAMLKTILQMVVKRWPEVEFMGSEQIIKNICK